jgi:hypothetical protein
LEALENRTQADELMLSTRTHSFEVRERSFTLIADAWGLEPVIEQNSTNS